jgi:hypothetical protein
MHSSLRGLPPGCKWYQTGWKSVRLSEEYEFDWRFYLISLAAIVLLLSVFYVVKRRVDIAHGRDVQVLVTKANLASMESARQQAKNWVRPLAARYKLSRSQTAKVEEIYTEYYHGQITYWTEDRIKGVAPAETNRKRSELRVQTEQKFREYLKSIGKEGN